MTAEKRSDSLVFHIDQLLEEVTELAKTETSASTFLATLLQRAAIAVDAQASALWMLGPDSTPVTTSSYRMGEVFNLATKTDRSGRPPSAEAAIRETVAKCIDSNQPKKLTANSKSKSVSVFLWPFSSTSNATTTSGPAADSAIAIYFTSELDPVLAPIYLNFAEAIAELAAAFQQRNNRTGQTDGQSSWPKFKTFSDALHESLNVRSTAVSLVNHGRNYYGCDRVLLARRTGRTYKVISSTGATSVNRKSQTVSCLEPLIAKAFYRNNKPVIFHGEVDSSSKLKPAFDKYQEICSNESLILTPITDKNDVVRFVQVIECKSAEHLPQVIQRVTTAQRQVQTSLLNAQHYQSIPMRNFLGAVGETSISRMLRWLAFPLALSGIIALAIIAMTIFKADLMISADGTIMPETERVIYAPQEGIVDKLLVDHGNHVQQGQKLVELKSVDLNSKISELKSEIATEKKKVAAIEALKNSLNRGTQQGQTELRKLAGDEIESALRMQNLETQLNLLIDQKSELTLTSPISGIIVTWDAKTKLNSRPVRPGDALLRVVAEDGNWLVEAHVADTRIAHLIGKASENKDLSEVAVSISVATFPGKEFVGKIKTVSQTAFNDPQTQQSTIAVVVEIEHDEDIQFQPRSSVVAKFNCGESSYGYAWFNEFIDSLYYRFF
ncbi:efflux RND transporter periplasmic adaptor subunit [bacterium]|nr:efflux RND transporter periplasmic adaptor subunit [bacterium]